MRKKKGYRWTTITMRDFMHWCVDQNGKTSCTFSIEKKHLHMPKTTTLLSSTIGKKTVPSNKVGPTIQERFKEAIGRRHHQILHDMNQPQKQGHWSWFLFPLLQDPDLKPSSGTQQYYLSGEEEMKEYLQSPGIQPYYEEMFRFLSRKGKDKIRSWLGADYYKMRTHIEQFKPVASALKMQKLVKIYEKLM